MSARDGAGVRATASVAALLYGGALLLLWWTRQPQPVYLVAAALATAGGLAAWLRLRPPVLVRGWLAWSAAVLWLGLAAGIMGTRRFQAIEAEWPALTAERRETLGGRLARQMTSVVARGRRAAELAAQSASGDSAPFHRLAGIRSGSGVDALAILTPAGDLWAWSGQHRGPLPAVVRAGAAATYFEERPLFSYLYFVRPVPGTDRQAVAGVLVETGVLGEEIAIEGTYAARSEVPATFRAGADPAAVWSLIEDGDTVVSARIEPATQSALRRASELSTARVIIACVILALMLVTAGWLRVVEPRPAPWLRALPLVAVAGALVVAPLGGVLGIEPLFSPLMFALPVPGDPSLGTLLALLIPLAALAAASRSPLAATRSPLRTVLIGAVAVAIAFPAGVHLMVRASAPDVLEESRWLWFALQPAATLLLALVALLGMPRARPGVPPPSRHTRLLLVLGGLAGTGLLSVLLVARLAPRPTPMPLAVLPWAIAFVAVALGLSWAGGRRGGLARWTAAVWLAGTAVAPVLWATNTSARLRAAERELSTLGTEAPPIIHYLLLEFGREVRARAAAGETGLQLLHRSWVASGLAREPWAARITLWRNGERAIELDLGQGEPSPYELSVLRVVVAAAAADTVPVVRDVMSAPLMAKVVTAPLVGGGVVTVTVPPRRTLSREGVIGSFLGDPGGPDARLTLIEATESTPMGGVLWNPTEEGWRSETVVPFPEGDYHAHLDVRTTRLPVRLARGVLLLALDLGLAALIWGLGCIGRGRSPVPAGRWAEWFGSFRARVTLALFGFFLLPTALFGWVAYRTVAGEVERAARIIASRAVAQAVVEWPESGGDLRALSERVGGEVLQYYRGELADASSPEGVDLGVYGAWMPPELYRRLESPEEVSAIDRQSIGSQSFLMAYRALPPAPVTLAVPSSLTSGDTADRQRELAHLILFAALVGALLSLALSVAVGRELAGPIGRLRRAAAAVGAGRLNVRLPDTTGEFGEVFASFNRMTRRLRRARAREVRMARVLAWGEMARQVAHEIKNPLTPIKLSVQHLRRAWHDRREDYDEILEENVQQILTEIDRLTEIARAFSRYGAPAVTEGPLESVNVAAVVHEALTLYRAGDPRIRYVDDIEPSLPPARARAGELKEVLLNLVENARAALDGGGMITLRAVHVGDEILLDVFDDGPGIPTELLDRVFEPHFSTRSAGTGLGLAIVRRLVESWGASVIAESEAGRGTAVRLRMRAGTASPGDLEGGPA